ncbi:MAG TPA: CsgG/HfaB family protein [Gemmatimonadaceae bacterium]|nr:CsgG/HfaB family protein [Gemmatimonadaceae bacterium]
MRLSRHAAAVLIAATTACAGQTAAPVLTPEALARLEVASRAASPSAAVLRALGVAYYDRGRDTEARAVLTRAQQLAPTDGVIALHLGLAAERQGDLAAAREAYTTYIRVGRTKRVRRQLEQRLAALARQEMVVAARRAVAREAQLAAQPGSPSTVAVLPFAFHGTDSTLRPIARGLTELLAVDLSRVSALTVVERLQVQALLDELALAGAGRTDSATAVRTGRLVRAGRVVQGAVTQLGGSALRADAAVVDATTAEQLGAARGSEPLDAVFALEKRLALDVLDALGVQLTAAERRELAQRPTRQLAAFLSYSSGLLAEDAGRLDEAERLYREAVRLDPGFSMARSRGASAAAARQGARVTAATVRASLAGSTEGQVVAAARRGAAAVPASTTLSQAVNGVNPSPAAAVGGADAAPTRDAASSTAGSDAVGAGTGRIHVIIRPPER